MADHGEVKLRDVNIQNLINIYHDAYKNITESIIGDTTAGKINKARTLATIKKQLQDLGDDVDKWVNAEIPQYYLDGANIAVQDLKKLGVDLSGPKGLAPINKEAIASLVDETNTAFATSLTAIQRNAAALVSDAQKQQLNFIIADGTLTGEALKTVASSVKQSIEDNGISALTDSAGKNWAFDTYANMLVRTKAVEARNAGLQNKMLQNGYDLVQVSDHNSDHPACADWEGAILSITGNTPGYDTTDDAEADGLMHPNCEHAYNVIDPDIADLTNMYDNPFNYDDAAADDEDIPTFKGPGSTGKEVSIPVFHAAGGTGVNSDGANLFGNAFYVARDKDTAEEFGSKIAEQELYIHPGAILKIDSDAAYNNLVSSAIKEYPDLGAQAAIPKFALEHGYQAIEATGSYDPLGGIALLDKSLLK